MSHGRYLCLFLPSLQTICFLPDAFLTTDFTVIRSPRVMMPMNDLDTAASVSAHVDQAGNVSTHDANAAASHPHQGNVLDLAEDTGAMSVITPLSAGSPSHQEAASGGIAVAPPPSPSRTMSDPTHRDEIGMPSASGLLASPGGIVASHIDIALDLFKDASGMIQSVPYLGVVTGALLQILKMREEVKYNRDKWNVIMDDIAKITDIIAGYIKVSNKGENVRGILLSEEVQQHLHQLVKILEDVQVQLSKCCDKGRSTSLLYILQRRKVKLLLDTCQMQVHTQLEFFNLQVNLSNNTDIHRLDGRVQILEQHGATTLMTRVEYTLPAKPQIMHGRDEIIAKLVTAIINGPSGRIALLGPGGIGKTAIILSVLHHDDIQKSYKCYFLACDAIESRDALIISIGQMLGVSANEKHILDESRVLDAVKNLGKAILCLDNFEVPWEAQSTEVEEFLPKLAAIKSVHLLITMRGEEAPYAISWSKYLITPLDLDAALRLFYDISKYNDEYTQKLVAAVDFVPLAVSLIAHYTQTSSPRKVWKQWPKDHFKVLTRKHGQYNRLSSVEYSIEVSLKSPRIKNDPQCLSILSILSLLPDGINESQEDDIQQVLEFEGSIADSLQTLKNCALISDHAAQIRVKLLSPILLYMQEHHPFQKTSPKGFNNLRAYVRSWIENCNQQTKDRSIRADCNNLRSLLQYCFQFVDGKNETMNMIVTFVDYCRYAGLNEINLLSQYQDFVEHLDISTQISYFCEFAVTKLQFFTASLEIKDLLLKAMTMAIKINNIEFQAHIHYTISQYYNDINLNQLNLIKDHLEKALQLHQQTQDILGQANDFHSLGMLNIQLDELDLAEHHFKEALKLHQQAHNILGQANDLQNLGVLDERLNKLDSAEKYFKEAILLHQQAQDVLGQGNDLLNLGELNIRLDKLDLAKQDFEAALKLHQQAQNDVGQAYDLQHLGKLDMMLGDLNSAKQYFEQALKIHQQAQDILGQGNNLQNLDELNIILNKLDSAKQHFKEALKLHQQAHNILGQGKDLHYLGQLDMSLNELDSAKWYLEESFKLHQQAQSILGQANDLQSLGRLNMRLNDLDSAKANLEQALKLHQQAQSTVGQANDLGILGDLSSRLNEFDSAKNYLKKASKLHQLTQNVSGQANDLQNLGELNMRLDELDLAKQHLEQALKLHQQAQNILGQANDLQSLGRLNMWLNNLDLAKEYLEQALKLHQQTQSTWGQADDLRNLGELHIKLDQFDSAKQHFEEALKLHYQVQNVLGQAYDLQNLGDLNLRLNKLDSAKQHFDQARQLHKQACNFNGEAVVLIMMQEVEARLNQVSSSS